MIKRDPCEALFIHLLWAHSGLLPHIRPWMWSPFSERASPKSRQFVENDERINRFEREAEWAHGRSTMVWGSGDGWWQPIVFISGSCVDQKCWKLDKKKILKIELGNNPSENVVGKLSGCGLWIKSQNYSESIIHPGMMRVLQSSVV